jgi:hypothetical protein
MAVIREETTRNDCDKGWCKKELVGVIQFGHCSKVQLKVSPSYRVFS